MQTVKESSMQGPTDVDLKALRQRLGLSQAAFARRYGFAVGSIRNWEQGCRQPKGPTRLLLRVIDREPEVVHQTLAAESDG